MKIKILELSNCYFTNIGKVFKNVEILQLRDCKNIDINHILNFKLQTLKILNTKIINFRSIQNIDTLENLYLNEVDLNNELNYEKLTKLKKINFDGSFINNKKEFLSQFETKNINISFSKNYEEIG
ncbi:MAG: hypothetical protein J6A89_07385 [Clostridia bacterium]|nr:hypothetical protein [Clostridia bacterium]